MYRLVIFILAITFFSCKEKPRKASLTGKEGEPMPAFNFQLAYDKAQIDLNKLDSGKSLVFLYFLPTCPYCRVETRRLVNNAKRFDSSRIVMISSASYKDIRAYSKEYGLDNISNIIVVRDTTKSSHKYFKGSGVPLLAIYNKEHKLKAVYKGLTSINDLAKATK